MQPVLYFYDFGEGVTAFSTTRQGGFSKGSYGEFNINRYCGDNVDAIRQNRALLCGLLGIDDSRLLMPHQVHETEIVAVNETTCEAELEGVDALMTNILGICIGVSTADCIPVLLYDKTHRAVCAIHACLYGNGNRLCVCRDRRRRFLGRREQVEHGKLLILHKCNLLGGLYHGGAVYVHA